MKRRALADERAVQTDAVHEALRGSALTDERILPVEGAVVEAHAHVAPDRTDPGLGENLNPEFAGIVRFRRKLIPGDPNRLDHGFRGKLTPFEAVDENLRVRPAHVHQLTAKLVGIVRERLDLLPRENRSERHVTLRRGLLAIPFHRDRGLHAIDRKDNHLAVVPAANAHLRQGSRLKSGKFGCDGIPPRRQVFKPYLSLLVRLCRLDGGSLCGRIDAGECHRGRRKHAARLVQYRDHQGRVALGLSDCVDRGEAREAEQDENAHHFLPEATVISPARISWDRSWY